MYETWQQVGPQWLQALDQTEHPPSMERDEVLHLLVDYSFAQLPSRHLREFCLYAPPYELRAAVQPYFATERYTL